MYIFDIFQSVYYDYVKEMDIAAKDLPIYLRRYFLITVYSVKTKLTSLKSDVSFVD